MSFNYSIPNMFDFDQRWDALPGDGSKYCVPTSTTNLMAFLSQNGYPKLWRRLPSYMPGSSPVFSNQNIVTNLGIMGDCMDTDSQNGTNMSDALEGIEDYVGSHYAGTWYSRSCASGDIIQIDKLKAHLEQKRIAVVCFGRYERDNPNDANSYDRMSGHCITLAGLEMKVSGATLVYHDPAHPDSNLNTQSAVSPRTCTISNHSLKTDGEWLHGIKMHTTNTSPLHMIDGYIVMAPYSVLHFDDITVTVSYSQEVNLAEAPTINTRKINVGQTIGEVKDMVLNAENTVAYLTAKSRKGIWKLTLASMELHLLNDAVQPDKIVATEKDDTLFVNVGSKIFSLTENQPLKEIAELEDKPDTLTYDFRQKKLIAVAGTNGRLYAIDKNVSVKKLDIPVINSVRTLNATVHPKTGLLYVLEEGSNRFLRISLKDDAVRSISEEQFETDAPLSNVQIDSKGVFATSGKGRLMFFNEKGVPIARPLWQNVPVGKLFKTSRSFNNLDPQIMRQKKWHN